MKIALAVAALSLCMAFPGQGAGLRPLAQAPAPLSGCVQHGVVRVGAASGRIDAPGCARFLATNRVVQPRHVRRG